MVAIGLFLGMLAAAVAFGLRGERAQTKSLDAMQLLPAQPGDASLFAEDAFALPQEASAPAVAAPKHIKIPKIEVDADIELVGVNENNTMEVPEDATKVGWFYPKKRPGEVGGAILTAHYDTTTGRPAVFYNIEDLAKGDQITVTTQEGEELEFIVDQLVSEPYDAFPVDIVYQEYANEKLVLITCDGVWDPLEQTYSNRLVVLANLVEAS